MKTEHPSPESLERFLRGAGGRETAGEIARHLEEEGCLRCLFAGRRILAEVGGEWRERLCRSQEPGQGAGGVRPEALERGVRQSLARGVVLGAERTVAPRLLDELERLSPEARRSAVHTTERYQLLGVAEVLSRRSREAVFHDVEQAQEVAALAVELADKLDPVLYGASLVAEQQALARACLGNALRVDSDLTGADQLFREALHLIDRWSDSSPVPADIACLLGSLRVDQERFLEARMVLEGALETYRAFEFRADECKVLLKLADVEGYSGNPERAVEILEEAVPLVDDLEDGRLRLMVHNNLTYWMVDSGRAQDALARFEEAQALYEENFQAPPLALRRRWLEGRIHAALGNLDLARAAFEEVRNTALDGGLSYELSAVSLELALVHLDRGEIERVRELAIEMTPFFRFHKMHRHATAATFLFHQASRQ